MRRKKQERNVHRDRLWFKRKEPKRERAAFTTKERGEGLQWKIERNERGGLRVRLSLSESVPEQERVSAAEENVSLCLPVIGAPPSAEPMGMFW